MMQYCRCYLPNSNHAFNYVCMRMNGGVEEMPFSKQLLFINSPFSYIPSDLLFLPIM